MAEGPSTGSQTWHRSSRDSQRRSHWLPEGRPLMACVTKRRGTWVVDVRLHGKRLVKVYRTRKEADEALSKLTEERRQKSRPAVDPFITLTDYVPRFLADCGQQEVAPATLRRYRRTLENHVLPVLGGTR